MAFDNRGHGQSEKLHAPADYRADLMTRDAANLLAHLGDRARRRDGLFDGGADRELARARASRTSCARSCSAVSATGSCATPGLPEAIAEAMEAPSLDGLADPTQRLFRAFAEQTKSDRVALAACARGFRRRLTPEEAARISQPDAGRGRRARRDRGRSLEARAPCCRGRRRSRSPAATTISRSATRRSRPGALDFLARGA